MKITVTWNRLDGTKAVAISETNPNDPHANDEEMQVHKAIGAAQAFFHKQYGVASQRIELKVEVSREG